MKKIIHALLVGLFLFSSNKLVSQIITTNNFQNLTVADGLVDDHVTDVLILNDSSIWVATTAGLSFYNGVNFTNYTALNSGLNNDNIRELEFCQNKIWMITSSGISSFNGATFINYTTTSGLINSVVEGIAATSTDTLWITTRTGTSKFDGTTFTNYPSQAGRDVETDSLDRVYVMRADVANNFPFARLYENGSWSMPTQSGINFGMTGAKLVKTASNELYVAGNPSTSTAFVRIGYPLNCERQSVFENNVQHSTLTGTSVIPAQLEELNGIRWIGGRTDIPLFHASVDSNYVPQYVSNSIAESSCIKAKNSILIVGSNRGLFITSPNIKSVTTGVEFAANSIRTFISVTNPLFSNVAANRPNFEFPIDSNSHGIYAANFIVAAKKANQVNTYLVYPQNSFTPAFTPGPITTTGGLARDFIVKVTQGEISAHQSSFNQPNYIMPDGIKNWPAFGDTTAGVAIDLAPFFDSNNNNCYDPQNGDYPAIKGDEAVYWINHPLDKNLKFEYHWMMYGYSNPSNKALNQSLFVQYTIVNRSNDIYDSVKVGFAIDGDLGNPADDYVGSDSLNNLLYFYNGDIFDETFNGSNGFGNTTPALGIKFLSDSLSNSLYYNVGNAVNGDPRTNQDWVNYLNSRWKNGQSITYGGNGYNFATSTVPTKYMFTGQPSTITGWTELSGVANAPGDRRLLGSIPSFSLQPNERKTIEIAVGYGRTASTSTTIGKNVPEMKSVMSDVGRFWDTLTVPVLTFATNDSCKLITSIDELLSSQNSLSVFPVPSSGELTIQTEENMTLIEVYDMKGAKIMSIPTRQNTVQLSLSTYRNGFYMIRVQLQDETWMMKKIIKQ